MLTIYKSLLNYLPEHYSQADMVRDFRRTFDGDSGKRVLASLMSDAMCFHAAPHLTDDELRALEVKRALVFHILDLATAKANADGTAETIKYQQTESTEDGGRTDSDRDDIDRDDWNPVG